MAADRPGRAEVLDRRRLNRAYLARQLLLRRERLGVPEAVEHLVGLQAQDPVPPYPALFARLEGFRFAQLSDLLEQRRLARATLMRGTIHLATARDVLTVRPLLEPHLERQIDASRHGKVVPAAGRGELLEFGRRLLAGGEPTVTEMREALAERWPERDAASSAHLLRFLLPTVHVPPRGRWGRSGPVRHADAAGWLTAGAAGGAAGGAPLDRAGLLRRYLAAFGPATAADVTTWSGMTGWRAVVEDLRPELTVLRDASGRELFDLPQAPRPSGDVPAPVRLIAPFDNLVLSHADRSRVVADADRPRLASRNGMVPGTLLVDGFVAGTWRWELSARTALLTVRPWRRLAPADAAAADSEAGALLAEAAPAAGRTVRILPPQD